ncbi:MAG: hypothetical protein Q9M82_03765 [Mariprofundus sp.]|nr:hypothetical protein [Mariprofundus sp.]
MKQLGIIAALAAEAQCLAGLRDGASSVSIASPKVSAQPSIQQISEHVCLVISGIGAERAAIAAAELIRHGVGALLSWGCAGGLSANLQPGDLLLPESVLPQASPSYASAPHASAILHVDRHWHACLLEQYPTASTGTLAESASILTEPMHKTAFHQSTGAVAVDMESAAIAKAARDAQLPFMAIRAIADDVETDMPACVHQCVDIYGKLYPLKLLPSLLAHPSTLPRLLRLGRHFHAARATLSAIANSTGSGLLEPVQRSG